MTQKRVWIHNNERFGWAESTEMSGNRIEMNQLKPLPALQSSVWAGEYISKLWSCICTADMFDTFRCSVGCSQWHRFESSRLSSRKHNYLQERVFTTRLCLSLVLQSVHSCWIRLVESATKLKNLFRFFNLIRSLQALLYF